MGDDPAPNPPPSDWVGLARNSAAHVWRPPPWRVPANRRPTLSARLVEAVAMGACYVAFNFSLSLPWTPWPSLRLFDPLMVAVILLSIGVAIVGAGYGVLMIATALRPRREAVWFFPGLTATASAARWYGMAFVLPQAVLWALTIAVHVTSIERRRDTAAVLLLLAGPLAVACAFVLCILLARRAATKPIKDAIVSGAAQSYYILPGLPAGYWWDGSHWRSLADSAPEGAVRSPGGNYWWSGGDWIPMPSHGFDSHLQRAADTG